MGGKRGGGGQACFLWMLEATFGFYVHTFCHRAAIFFLLLHAVTTFEVILANPSLFCKLIAKLFFLLVISAFSASLIFTWSQAWEHHHLFLFFFSTSRRPNEVWNKKKEVFFLPLLPFRISLHARLTPSFPTLLPALPSSSCVSQARKKDNFFSFFPFKVRRETCREKKKRRSFF